MLHRVKVKLKQEFDILRGRKSRIIKGVQVPHRWYGGLHAGFFVYPERVGENALVYSFGTGEDVSFDIAMMKNHGCTVHAFDPTPKSIEWVAQQPLPPGFHFHPYGIGAETGTVRFNLPVNENHVSGSIVEYSHLDTHNSIEVPMRSFADILSELGHDRIDVLKMDIEGSEYEVIPAILDADVEIGQILVEKHERYFPDGREKTRRMFEQLNDNGFLVFGVSDSLEEISLINSALLT